MFEGLEEEGERKREREKWEGNIKIGREAEGENEG